LIGVDEVGRGSFAGPVVVTAVLYDHTHPIDGLDDSKKLSPKRREELARLIEAQHTCRTVAIPVEKIETLNILGATMLGMHEALEAFRSPIESGEALVVVDGNIKVPEVPEDRQTAIVKADAKSACVAAASIVAKVTRDMIMDELSEFYPEYGFLDNKGYGSPDHIKAIRSRGLCVIHRYSFCRKFLPHSSGGGGDNIFL